MALGDGLALLFKIKSDSTDARRDITSLRTTVAKELKDIDNAAKFASGSFGGLSGAMNALMSPTTLLTGGALALGTAVFTMGKQAIDTAGQLSDLNAKTNISIETLSTLSLVGEKVGVDINSLGASFAILQKNMVAAHDSTSEQSTLFKSLNIDINDNEQALRDAFRALSAMEEGAEQTDAALKLFGRSGTQVLAILKEMNGDIDGTMEKFRESNQLMTGETAKALDDVGDAFTALGQNAKGAALGLMTNLAPALESIITILNVAIGTVRALGQALDTLTLGLLTRQDFGYEWVDRLGLRTLAAGMDRGGRFGATKKGSTFFSSQLGGLGTGPRAVPNLPKNPEDLFVRPEDPMGGASRPGGLFRGAGGGTRGSSGRDVEGTAFLRNYHEAVREHERLFKEAIKDFDAAQKKAASDAEKAAIDHQKALSNIAQTYQRARIEQLKDDAEQNKISHAEAERLITKIILDEYAKRGLAAMQARDKEKYGTEEYQRLNDIYLQIQADASAAKEEAERRKQRVIRDTLELERELAEEGARRIAESMTIGPQAGVTSEQMLGAMYGEGGIGGPPVPDFSAWKEAVADVKEMTVNSFKSMGEAMGSAIQAWVLYGNEGGQSIRKVMASVLAALSAEAAVKALFQLAEGFAKLAGFMPGPAALHFKAAALYGAVAVGAGVAGRALAGNSFSQGAAGGATAGGASGGGTSPRQSPVPIDVNRRAGDAIAINVNVKRDPGSIVEIVVDDYRQNGRTRQAFNNDGQLAVA